MATYPSVYKARAVKYEAPVLTAFVPQVFGNVAIEITEVIGAPTQGMGWVFFQGGNPEFPVWNGGVGGSVSDVVWAGPDAPTDKSIELWWDTDEEAPLDPRYLTPSDAETLYLTQAEVDARVSVLLSPAWIAMPLVNGWVNYAGGGFVPAGYRKVGDTVQIRGLISKPSTPISTICTLPTGYRPPLSVLLQTWASWNSSAVRGAIRLDLSSAGVLAVASSSYSLPSGAAVPTLFDHLQLDGLNFSTSL